MKIRVIAPSVEYLSRYVIPDEVRKFIDETYNAYGIYDQIIRLAVLVSSYDLGFGLSFWRVPVNGFVNNLPDNPEDGERYVISHDAEGELERYRNYIAVFRKDSDEWLLSAPEEGTVVYNRPDRFLYFFDGEKWEKLTVACITDTFHNDLSGIQGGTEYERYHLTEEEWDTLVHGNDASGLHNHDSLYYRKEEADTTFSFKSHTHNLDAIADGKAYKRVKGVDDEHRITTESIKDGAITAEKIAEGAITSEKIPDLSITEEKIADGSITTAKISDGAVTAEKIATGSVTEEKIADSAVTSSKIADGSVTEEKISDLSVTTAKIDDSAVVTSKIADGAVTREKIADSSVTAEKIADGSIGREKIGNFVDVSDKGFNADMVDGCDVDDDAVASPYILWTSSKINQIKGEIMDTISSLTLDDISDGSEYRRVRSVGTDNRITTDSISDYAVTNPKIAENSIDATKIAPNVDMEGKRFNADMVDGRDVEDGKPDRSKIWTSKMTEDEIYYFGMVLG